MKETIIGIAVVVGVIALYIITYVLNKNTDVPEGTRDLPNACGACSAPNCSISSKNINETVKTADVVNDLRKIIEDSKESCVRK